MSAPNNNPAQPRNANGVVLPAQSQATTSAPHAQAAVPNPTTQGSTTQAVRPKSTLPTSPFTPLTLFSLTHSLTHTHTLTHTHSLSFFSLSHSSLSLSHTHTLSLLSLYFLLLHCSNSQQEDMWFSKVKPRMHHMPRPRPGEQGRMAPLLALYSTTRQHLPPQAPCLGPQQRLQQHMAPATHPLPPQHQPQPSPLVQ